jgi:hypothetical protein
MHNIYITDISNNIIYFQVEILNFSKGLFLNILIIIWFVGT